MNKLIYISSSWCGPCRTLSPIMSKVAESGIPVQKMDADDDEVKEEVEVRNIPTVIKVDGNGNTIYTEK